MPKVRRIWAVLASQRPAPRRPFREEVLWKPERRVLDLPSLGPGALGSPRRVLDLPSRPRSTWVPAPGADEPEARALPWGPAALGEVCVNALKRDFANSFKIVSELGFVQPKQGPNYLNETLKAARMLVSEPLKDVVGAVCCYEKGFIQ